MLGMLLPAGNRKGRTYRIGRSLRLSTALSANLSRVTGPAPTNVDKFTISVWAKRGILQQSFFFADGQAQPSVRFELDGSDRLYLATGNPSTIRLLSIPVYRDPTAWGHFHMIYDAANATAALRCRLFYNGVELPPAAFSTDLRANIAAGQNASGWNAISKNNYIGRNGFAAQNYLDGYLAEYNNIDGQALLPTAFGMFDANGVWIPIKYAGTYGAQGFYLDFSDNSDVTAATIGKDRSGNNNDWTPNGISVTPGNTNDSMLDSPTDFIVSGVPHSNFPTLSNDLAPNAAGTLSRGGLQFVSGTNTPALATFCAQVDDPNIYYFEMTMLAGTDAHIDVGPPNCANGSAGYATGALIQGVTYRSDGKVWNNNANIITLANFAIGDTVGCAFQASTGKVWMIDKTGLISAVPVWVFPNLQDLNAGVSGVSSTMAVNFGQQPFKFAPQPAGAKRMCSLNLPSAGKPMAKALQYSGIAGAQSISGLGFRPALLILKQSTAIAGRMFADILADPTKPWDTNTNAAQLAAVAGFSFDADGFTLPGNTASISTTGGQFSAYAFAKGAVNGFDVVTWTGDGTGTRNIPHGLQTTPDCIWLRGASAALGMATPVWFRPYSDADMLTEWGGVSNSGTGSPLFLTGNVSPTTFEVGTSLNVLNAVYVAFVFSNRPGVLRVVNLVGNGLANGPRVALGFRPAIVMIKKINPTGTGSRAQMCPSFAVPDSNPLPSGSYMFSALADTPISPMLDRISDGVKIKSTDASFNTSAWEYGLIAFAAQAAKYARAV